jgi:hypothetical protein
MRLLVAGGRTHGDAVHVFRQLDAIHAERPITTVIHGAAQGADTLGGLWALAKGIPVEAHPADWEQHGRAAGPIRNAAMLATGPDGVAAFAGGVGTQHMVTIARKAGVPVVEYPAPLPQLSRRVRVTMGRIDSKALDRLDVTRKSGTVGLPFAPSWAILKPALDARKESDEAFEAAWAAYVPAYLSEMRASYRRERKAWEDLLARRSVTVCCYCVRGDRCHRALLAGVLGRLGAWVVGEERER